MKYLKTPASFMSLIMIALFIFMSVQVYEHSDEEVAWFLWGTTIIGLISSFILVVLTIIHYDDLY